MKEKLKSHPILRETSIIDKTETIENASELINSSPSKALLVVEKKIIKGILTRENIFQHIVLQKESIKNLLVKDIMTKKVTTVHASNTLQDVLTIMVEKKITKIPVIDEDNILGIVTEVDLLNHLEQQAKGEIKQKANELIKSSNSLEYAKLRNERIESELYYSTDFAQRTARHMEILVERAKSMASEARQANIAKNYFMANISHELRTPMNHIIGYLSLLEDTTLKPDQQEYIKKIQIAGDSLLTLINDILDYTAVETGTIALDYINFNFRSTVHDVYKTLFPFSVSKGVKFILDIGPSIPDILNGDPGRFRQILMNLCDNALKFTKEGHVLLSIDLKEEQRDKVGLLIEVRDTGIGIPPSIKNRLFKLFEQGNSSLAKEYEGIGIGLALTKKLVTIMSGDIGVESNIGKGSTFWVKMNFNKANLNADVDLLLRDFKNKHILLFDDNITKLSNYNQNLHEWGCSFSLATTHNKSIELIKKAVAENITIDAIIINQSQPEIDFEKILPVIKENENLKNIPLIYIGKAAYRGDGEQKFQDGFAGYLSSPFQWKDLHDCLSLVFNLKHNQMSLKDFGLITTHKLNDLRCHKNISILIIDDDEINLQLMMIKLKKYDLKVNTSTSEEQTIKMMKEHSYNLILIDGYSTAIKIRKLDGGKKVPIVALCTDSFEDCMEQCLEAGINDYLMKPVNFSKLIDIMHKWIPSLRTK